MNRITKIKEKITQFINKDYPSKWWKVPRAIIFLIGIISIRFFWFSFIGIMLGLLYFLILKENAWKRNGLTLALVAGIFTFITENSTVIFAYVGMGIMLLLVIIFFITDYILIPKFQNFTFTLNYSKRTRKLLMILVSIVPIMFWSVVSINLGVLFDNETKLLWINVPSTSNSGEPFEITVEAWDNYERLSATYRGKVKFHLVSYNPISFSLISSQNADLPNDYTFTGQLIGSDAAYLIKDGKDNGKHVFSAKILTPGYHYICVEDTYTGNTYWSNPILIENNQDSMILWGDLHSHSEWSDGSGTPEHAFQYAREVALLDYYSLTDHGEHLDLFGLAVRGNNLFSLMKNKINLANDPGEFVVFQGAEWTTGYITTFNRNYGHFTCVFSGDELPEVSANSLITPDDLWNLLDDFTSSSNGLAIAIPHHTTRASFIQDWTHTNPEYVKLAEVASVHGESLFEPWQNMSYMGCVDPPATNIRGACINDALMMGYKMTFIANGDSHDGHPGHSLSHTEAYIGHQYPQSIWHPRNDHPYPSGLTAVYADNITREDIFDALYDQQVFANSDYGRPILYLTINGIGLDDSTTVKVPTKNSPRILKFLIAQDGSPAASKQKASSVNNDWAPDWRATVEIIKNGELLFKTYVATPLSQITYTDSKPIIGASFEDEVVKIDGNYYINEYSNNPINPSELNTNGSDFYYVRVTGSNGRTSYIGPIWVET